MTGLAMVNGSFNANPSSLGRPRSLIPNGESYPLVVAVRKDLVRCFVDGVQHCVLKSDFKNLSPDPTLQTPGKGTLGLCFDGDAISGEVG